MFGLLPSEWRTALCVCVWQKPWFKDVFFFSLKWMAPLSPLSNQQSSLSSTRTWLSSKQCPLSFRCRCTAKSCPEEVARLCWAIRLWMGCCCFPNVQFIAFFLALYGPDDIAVCVLVFCPWGGPVSVWGCWRVWTALGCHVFGGFSWIFPKLQTDTG